MNQYADLLLVFIIVVDLYTISTSRVVSSVRACAVQGVSLALLPLALWAAEPQADLGHVLVMSAGTLVLKAVMIPALLLRAIRAANVHREVQPFVSLHVSVLLAAGLVGIAFWFATVLQLPNRAPSALLVPAAFATLLVGFLVLVSRRKAITQVVGYLMIENGVFIFGQTLVREIPFAVELGILLDLLVGVFVMGIAINHISREFDDIDTELLATLRD